MRRLYTVILLITALTGQTYPAEPVFAPHRNGGKVAFALSDSTARSVHLAGSFNGWNAAALPMAKNKAGIWRVAVALPVGFHEYKFVVDGRWLPDPGNPAQVVNNYGDANSVLYVTSLGEVELRAPKGNDSVIEEPGGEGFIYLALIWHQHQPNYYDPEQGHLIAPWVRTHTTKDYYDMTAMVADYPDIHVSVNLTPILLDQMQNYYADRLGFCSDRKTGKLDVSKMLYGHMFRHPALPVDPWVTLMAKRTQDFTEEDVDYLFRDEWSCFSVSRVIMSRFPEYAALREKPVVDFTLQDRLNLKCFFWLANFDPDFLRGPVPLVTGDTVDLSDLVIEEPPDEWRLIRPFTEDDAQRLVVEAHKIAAAVLPLHRQMAYHPESGEGQVELLTTPYYHPILPLLCDLRAGRSESDQPPDSVENAYSDDARRQVSRAYHEFRNWMKYYPSGMWPAEGAVSPEAASIFAEEGLDWIATGDGVLAKSKPKGLKADRPYRFKSRKGNSIAIFFRDTELSDLIGFRYQRWDPEEAAEDLARQILTRAPQERGDTAVVTILLDGENAWEWYEKDPDGKQFLREVYRRLNELQEQGRLKTATPVEYLRGNPARGIPPHPVKKLPRIKELWPGSWIRADFSTWVGEPEENRAWWWLNRTREQLEPFFQRGIFNDPYWIKSGDLSQYQTYYLKRAAESMLAAEGSDWFWWYGQDQNSGEGDRRWDALYRSLLRDVFRNLYEAGFVEEVPDIPCLLDEAQDEGGGGAMREGD